MREKQGTEGAKSFPSFNLLLSCTMHPWYGSLVWVKVFFLLSSTNPTHITRNNESTKREKGAEWNLRGRETKHVTRDTDDFFTRIFFFSKEQKRTIAALSVSFPPSPSPKLLLSVHIDLHGQRSTKEKPCWGKHIGQETFLRPNHPESY